MPKFSIIIPVYNVAPYLRECLDSVLAQTFTDWEAICVDDGSSDASGVILDEYSDRDVRIRVIHQLNAGVSAARNAAMADLKGEWFLFLDGDDMFRPDALEHFMLVLAHEKCDAILMQPYVEWIPRDCVVPTSQFEVIQRMSNGFHLMTEEISANGFAVGRIYKTSKFSELRFRSGLSICEDLLFWSEAVRVPAKWVAVRGSYYFYRQREGSACRRLDFARYSQIIDVMLGVVREMVASDPSGLVVKRYWHRYRWSCEQVKDAFLLWRTLGPAERARLLSYQDSVKAVCPGIPFSLKFRLAFGMHRAHLHSFYKHALFVLRIGGGIARRIRKFLRSA